MRFVASARVVKRDKGRATLFKDSRGNLWRTAFDNTHEVSIAVERMDGSAAGFFFFDDGIDVEKGLIFRADPGEKYDVGTYDVVMNHRKWAESLDR